jgi:hypothetical protein
MKQLASDIERRIPEPWAACRPDAPLPCGLAEDAALVLAAAGSFFSATLHTAGSSGTTGSGSAPISR